MQMDDNALGNDMSTMQPSLWKTPASSHLCRSHLTKADAPNARQYGTAVSVQVGSRNIGGRVKPSTSVGPETIRSCSVVLVVLDHHHLARELGSRYTSSDSTRPTCISWPAPGEFRSYMRYSTRGVFTPCRLLVIGKKYS